jgi:UDP:flavonoid glycosyltransferase YjiC (YdhE family)
VLLTIGPDHERSELGDLPSNVRVETVVPHSVVLQKSQLVVSHAGHGTVMKALWYGVPMLLVPWGRDQPGVAARAEALGVATVVPRESADAESIATAARQVLSSPAVVAAARHHAVRLQATNPQSTAADIIQAVNKE